MPFLPWGHCNFTLPCVVIVELPCSDAAVDSANALDNPRCQDSSSEPGKY